LTASGTEANNTTSGIEAKVAFIPLLKKGIKFKFKLIMLVRVPVYSQTENR